MKFLVLFLVFAAATAAPSGDQGSETNPQQSQTPPVAAGDAHVEHSQTTPAAPGDAKAVPSQTTSAGAGDAKAEHSQTPPAATGDAKAEHSQTTPAAAGDAHSEHSKGGSGNLETHDHKVEAVQDKNTEKHDFTFKEYGPYCSGKTSSESSLSYEKEKFTLVEEVDLDVVECNIGVDIFSAQNEHLAHIVHDAKILACGKTCQIKQDFEMTKDSTQFYQDAKKPGFNPTVKAEEREKIEAFDKEIREKNQYKIDKKFMALRMEDLKRAKNKRNVAKAAAVVKNQAKRVVLVRKKGAPMKIEQHPGDGTTAQTESNQQSKKEDQDEEQRDNELVTQEHEKSTASEKS